MDRIVSISGELLQLLGGPVNIRVGCQVLMCIQGGAHLIKTSEISLKTFVYKEMTK